MLFAKQHILVQRAGGLHYHGVLRLPDIPIHFDETAWICAKYGCRIYWALESSNHVDQIKSRHDKMEAVRKKSPFEKDAE